MSRRTIIIEALLESLASETQSSGTRGMRFLHEINSFPAFYIHPTREQRVYRGDGSAFGVMTVAIRGYTWGDNLSVPEAYGRDIETAVQLFYLQHREFIEDARVISFKTDEGLLLPNGVVDLIVEIIYVVQDGLHQPPKMVNRAVQDGSGVVVVTETGQSITVPTEYN